MFERVWTFLNSPHHLPHRDRTAEDYLRLRREAMTPDQRGEIDAFFGRRI